LLSIEKCRFEDIKYILRIFIFVGMESILVNGVLRAISIIYIAVYLRTGVPS
jgi:hypothetical protein